MASKKPDAEFARLFAEHHRRIYAYVRALVPDRNDAEDVVQNTCVVLWERFEEFQLGTDFAAWAIAVAFNQVRTHRNRQQRERLRFSDTLMEKITSIEAQMASEAHDRQAALQACLEKLQHRDRELLSTYYSPATSARTVSARLRMPVTTVYKTVDRLRKRLFECVERQMSRERP